MANPIESLQESFSLGVKKESLIFGLILFVLSIAIVLVVALFGGILGFIGLFILAIIDNVYVTLIALILALIIGAIILLLVQSAIDIISFKGFSMIAKTGKYDFEVIMDTLKERLIPTTILLAIISFLIVVIGALIGIPLFFITEAINIPLLFPILVIFILLIAYFFISPLLITAQPRIILERTSAIKALTDSIKIGGKNYLFNLSSIIILGVVCCILTLLSLIPLVGLIVVIFIGILQTHYLIKIYEENNQRSN